MEKLSIALYTMLAALGLVASLPSCAQEGVDLLADMENNNLQIRQKAGTDSVLANFFAGAGIEEDTIYAFMYRPGNCPRCEAGFKTFCDLLHKKGKKFTLISVFDDASVSNYYNKMKGYAADYYLNDTAGVCLKAFSFNNIPLDGSNVLKVTRQGRPCHGWRLHRSWRALCGAIDRQTQAFGVSHLQC